MIGFPNLDSIGDLDVPALDELVNPLNLITASQPNTTNKENRVCRTGLIDRMAEIAFAVMTGSRHAVCTYR